MSPSGSGYFTCIQNMKLVTNKFKSGGLHEKHVVATWNLGNHLSCIRPCLRCIWLTVKRSEIRFVHSTPGISEFAVKYLLWLHFSSTITSFTSAIMTIKLTRLHFLKRILACSASTSIFLYHISPAFLRHKRRGNNV